MMNLKLVWCDDGKKTSSSITVYAKEEKSYGFSDVISLTDIRGSGSCYGYALQEFASQLNEYIDDLCKFRDEVVNTTKSYTEATLVDFKGRPLN